jgi:hypothetical protein
MEKIKCTKIIDIMSIFLFFYFSIFLFFYFSIFLFFYFQYINIIKNK